MKDSAETESTHAGKDKETSELVKSNFFLAAFGSELPSIESGINSISTIPGDDAIAEKSSKVIDFRIRTRLIGSCVRSDIRSPTDLQSKTTVFIEVQPLNASFFKAV